MKINQIINEGLVFYAKNPDGTKTYSLVKDAEHLANLEQKYRGAQVQKLDFARQDVQDWLDSRGVNLRRFPPGMETTVGPNQGVAEGDTQLQPGMQVKDGTIVKVDGNTVTVKTSNGDLMNMNIHDVDVAQNMAEGKKKSEPPEADYGADYQDMVSRVKKLAGLGPLKTVYDPQKRVYKNVPKAEQPKK